MYTNIKHLQWQFIYVIEKCYKEKCENIYLCIVTSIPGDRRDEQNLGELVLKSPKKAWYVELDKSTSWTK